MTLRPYYQDATCTLYHGDCFDVLPQLQPASFNLCLADPPYGDTSLDWDVRDLRWLDQVGPLLEDHASLWCFGSFRMFMAQATGWHQAGWHIAQDVIWEKHNGSNFHADRFKRVHEHVVHFYRRGIPWESVYNQPIKTNDAYKRVVRRKRRPAHTGEIDRGHYTSDDGGPRLMRSVIFMRSEHGRAVHETQKPVGICLPLVEASCPSDGALLDPMCGSGTSLVAAKHLGRRAVGIEIAERHCENAARRLSQELNFGTVQ